MTEASRGEEALDALATLSTPRLVLLDLTMPGIGGAETYRRMRETAPRVPVLLMSGYSIDAMPPPRDDARPAGFLQKPFRADDFYQAVANALD